MTENNNDKINWGWHLLKTASELFYDISVVFSGVIFATLFIRWMDSK